MGDIMSKSYLKRLVLSVFLGLFLVCLFSGPDAFSQTEITPKSGINAEKAKAKKQTQEKISEEIEVLEKKEAKLKDELEKTKISGQQEKFEELTKMLQDIKKQKAAKRSLLDKSITSIAIIFLGMILFVLLRLGVGKFETLITKQDVLREDELTLRVKTLSKLFNWIGGFVVFGLIIYMLLENLGISVAPLLAGAGIIGLAFGFGGQYLIRDLINGLFILIEGQYRISDVVKIGEYGGLVENINLRITTLRDLRGRIIIVPNGEIKTVVNYTKEYAQALLDIGVAYKENVDKVMDVIKQVGEEMRGDKYFGRLILGDLEMLGVDDFADSAVIIKFRMKTLPIRQWEVMREFRRRLKNRFDELGIEIPFPHRTMYWGSDKDNMWPKDLAEKFVSGKGE